MRAIIVLILLISMLSGSASVLAVEAGSPSSWAKGAVERGIELGIVPERLQSNYQSPITREEFAELVVSAVFANVKDNAADDAVFWTREQLLDVVDLAVEFEDAKQDHVRLAYMLGSVNGISNTMFAPDRHITRQEAAMMLINTVHSYRAFTYPAKEELAYSDFDNIASWARPAVQAAGSMGLMEGVGGKFDYEGKFTREQSIATVLRLYDNSYRVMIRGNLLVNAAYTKLRYTVGKDFIWVHYQKDGEFTKLEEDMYHQWNADPVTQERKDEFSMDKAIALFGFQSVLRPRDFTGMVEPTIVGKTSKWDYGYMIVTTFSSDGLVKFEYPSIQGYMTMINGYKYGYPFKDIAVTEIKN